MLDRARYGIDSKGNSRSVEEVARGLDCGLICTKCKQQLVAKKGAVRVHHLAHYNPNSNCVGSLESQLHFLAKEALKDSPQILLPDLAIFIDGFRPRDLAYVFVLCGRSLKFDSIEIEKAIADLRVDAVGSTAQGKIAIEIKVSHSVTEEKAAKLQVLGIPCFEIDVSSMRRWDIDRDEVRSAVLFDKPRKWLVQPTAFFSAEFADGHAEIERFKKFLITIKPQPQPITRSSELVAIATPPPPAVPAASPTYKIDQGAWALARRRLGIPDPGPPPPGLTQDQVEAIRVYFPNWLSETYP